ncbi:MAG TPA: hypothetical protein VF950_02590 [Planctomycetota bacterium]
MLAALLALVAAQEPARPPKAEKAEIVANLQWSLGRPVDAEWQPLDVDLQSAVSKDLDVQIVIDEDASRTRVVRRETVPAGGRRRLCLHLPTGRLGAAAFSTRPVMSIRGPGGRELATFTLTAGGRSWAQDEILVGLVTSDPAPDTAFGLGWKAGGSTVEVARMAADRLPDRWVGLAPLRMILIHGAPLDALSPDQGQALRDYVRQGGTLVLSPGVAKGGLAHPAIAAIVEIRTGEAETRTELPALTAKFGPFQGKTPFRFMPIREAPSLPGLEDTGIVRYEAGFGQVIALPFDLVKAPFDGWPGTVQLMTSLIVGAKRADLEWASGAGLPPELGQGVRRGNVLGRMLSLINPYPSWPLLAGLTLLYLAVIGPVNYLILRRLRMTLLLVATVPAISLLFLSLTLGLAYLIKGGTTTVTSLRVLATSPGLACARETRLTAVFSPSTRAYDIGSPPGRAALPVDRALFNPDERHDRAAALETEEGASTTFRGVPIGQWQSWAFETRAVADLGAGVRWELRNGKVRVKNGSAFSIERAILVRAGRGGWSSPVGAIAPGGDVEAPLDTARWSPIADLGFDDRSLGARVLGGPLGGLRLLYQRDDGRSVVQQEEILVCVIREDGPGAEVNARLSGESRSVSVLFVRKERS